MRNMTPNKGECFTCVETNEKPLASGVQKGVFIFFFKKKNLKNLVRQHSEFVFIKVKNQNNITMNNKSNFNIVFVISDVSRIFFF